MKKRKETRCSLHDFSFINSPNLSKSLFVYLIQQAYLTCSRFWLRKLLDSYTSDLMSIHQDMLKAKHQVDILTGYHELKTVPSGLDAQPINSTYAQMVANKGKGPASSKKPPTSSTKATEDEGMGFVEALFDRSVVMHKCLSSQQALWTVPD